MYDPPQALVLPEGLRFDKARISGFWSSELPMHKWLREAGKTTLLFPGVNTHQCVSWTLTNAYS